MKPSPCPKCGNEDVVPGDCGYSSFNVAWVICKECNLKVRITGDCAISTWNAWVKDPAGMLAKQMHEDADQKYRVYPPSSTAKRTIVDISEYAVEYMADCTRWFENKGARNEK